MAVTAAKLSTGRRKEAIARVRLVPGEGGFTINGRALDEYFPTRVHRMVATAALRTVGRERDYDVIVSIRGGGVSGQAGAVRMTTVATVLEFQRDWANRDHYNALMDIFREHGGAYGMGIEYAYTMVHKAEERTTHGPRLAPVAAEVATK